MSYTTTRDEISSQLSGITGIGKVFKSRRYAQDWSSFLARFKDANNKINVTWFHLASAQEQPAGVGSENIEGTSLWIERREFWNIEVFYGFHDADDAGTPSEYVFQEICENIESKFRFLQTLNDSVEKSYQIQRIYSGLWQFLGEVLCHKAEFQLELRYRI